MREDREIRQPDPTEEQRRQCEARCPRVPGETYRDQDEIVHDVRSTCPVAVWEQSRAMFERR